MSVTRMKARLGSGFKSDCNFGHLTYCRFTSGPVFQKCYIANLLVNIKQKEGDCDRVCVKEVAEPVIENVPFSVGVWETALELRISFDRVPTLGKVLYSHQFVLEQKSPGEIGADIGVGWCRIQIRGKRDNEKGTNNVPWYIYLLRSDCLWIWKEKQCYWKKIKWCVIQMVPVISTCLSVFGVPVVIEEKIKRISCTE